MGNVQLHDKANDYFASILEQVPPEKYDAAAPCEGWCARDVIEHVTGGNRMFAGAAKGLAFPTGGAEAAAHQIDDLVAAFRASADEAREAWSAEGVSEKMVALPFGTMPGEVAIGIHASDLIIHSWDLAKSAGIDVELPSDLVEGAMAVMVGFGDMTPLRGPGKPFAAAVEVGADATPAQKLIALSGRQP